MYKLDPPPKGLSFEEKCNIYRQLIGGHEVKCEEKTSEPEVEDEYPKIIEKDGYRIKIEMREVSRIVDGRKEVFFRKIATLC